jgi:surfeit locus 1 family protein
LAICACLGFAVLIGLGVWQLGRLEWKQGLLAKIAVLRNAPPRPLETVLPPSTPAGNPEFRRVSVTCLAPIRASPPIYRYALRDGQVAWRLMGFCPSAIAPYDGILLDRGLVQRFAGLMAPSAQRFPDPARVVGVLRAPGSRPWIDSASPAHRDGMIVARLIDADTLTDLARASGASRPAPYFVAVESEDPAPAGVTPVALPQDVPNNHLGYAMTWFGLAAALAWVAGGLVRRRLASP